MKATKQQHHKGLPGGWERPWKRPGPGMRTWLLRVGTSVLVWTALVQLMSVMELWHTGFLTYRPPWPSSACLNRRHGGTNATAASLSLRETGGDSARGAALAPPTLLPRRVYKNNGYLRISCNGGLNQMRAAICDMVTVARYLNLTLLVPELDKTSFWADSSDFQDIFDVKHFINSLRDEVRVVKSLPVKYSRKAQNTLFSMPPVSWSSDKYYLEQILPLFRKHKIVHFNKTDARLANNGLPLDLQRLRCRVNYEALHFAPGIQALGDKLISMLKQGGSFVVVHLRYEMDMLSFSGCTQGCSDKEAGELTRMRYMYPWWKEKEIVSDVKRLDGLCPLTPEETTLVLQALGFSNNTQIYIAAGEIYGGERRLSTLRAAFPKIVKKEMLLSPDELGPYLNHSTQMAALDYIVSVASDVFIPTYDGNMAKVVEGHRRYLGFRKTIKLARKALVRLLDMHQNGTMSWEEFSFAVRDVHKHRMGGPTMRIVMPDGPKEEDYFYANPQECLGPLDLETRSKFVDI